MKKKEIAPKKIEGPSVPRLEQLWRVRIETILGYDADDPTPKNFGQLKMLRQSLGDLSGEVIIWAVENWDDFASDAKIFAGLPSAPEFPHIGFLLTHHHVAVDLMYQQAKKKHEKSEADVSLISNIDKRLGLAKKQWEPANTIAKDQG
jgi:hypothetical protein